MSANGPAALVALTAALLGAAVDARWGIIPNRITYPAATLLLALAAGHDALAPALLGLLWVGGGLLALYALTRRRGLGLGDVKLGACIGLGLGPLAGVTALGVAFVCGGTVAAWLLATRRARRGDALRFGPFLAVGTLAAMLASFGPLAARLVWSGLS